MKRFFTTLKSVVCVALVACMMGSSVVSCSSYDDTGIKEEINKINKELAALKERVAALETKLQSEVDALTALINGKVVVASVETKGDSTVVTLSDGTTITIGGEFTDTDTNTTLAPAKGDDGVYYWAVYNNGEFANFLEVDGAYVPVFFEATEGCDCEPADLKFMVDETTGSLLVSIDGGNTWVDSGIAAEAAEGSCVFTDVVVNENGTVTLVLADGSEIVVAQAELINFNVRGSLYVKGGETRDVTFEAGEAVADVTVMNQPMGWKAVVNENVLSVTAPTAELVALGVAEKSGVIALHINTESGSCKVAKLEVNYAELSLNVEKDGSVTVKNSLVATFMAYDYETWEYVEKTDFVSYTLGVMMYDDYTGDLEADLYSDANYWTCNDENLSYYLTDYTYERQTYQDGVFDERVLTTNVKSLVEGLSMGVATYDGNSFIIFVVPMDMTSYSQDFSLSEVAEFMQVAVKAEVVKEKFNSVDLNVTLRGAAEYHLMYNEAKYIDQQIEWGYTAADYYQNNFYNWINYNMDWGSAVIREDISGEFNLYDLMNYGNTDWPMNTNLMPNTEYEFAILPVEEGRAKETYTYDDIVIFRFTTTGLVEAATPAEVVLDVTSDYSGIYAEITVPETIVGVYSAWYSSEFVLDEETLYSHINSAWLKYDFSEGYTYAVSNTGLNPGETRYMVLVAVDADGNYTFVQKSGTTKTPEINTQYTLGIGNYGFDNGTFTVELTGIDGADVTKYRYYMVNTNYYANKSNETISAEMAISSNWMYQTLEGENVTNPVNIVLGLKTYNYDYLVAGTTYKFAILAQFADGTFSNVAFVDEAEYALNVLGEDDAKWAETKPELIDLSCTYSTWGYWDVAYNFTTAEGITVYTRLVDEETMNSYPLARQKVSYLVDNSIDFWDGCYSAYANTLQTDIWYCWSDAEGNYYAATSYDLEADLTAAQAQ